MVTLTPMSTSEHVAPSTTVTVFASLSTVAHEVSYE